MNINLWEQYWVRTDPLNYILYEIKTVQDKTLPTYGQEYESVIGFYGTLQSTLSALCREEIRTSKCSTLQGLIKEVQKMEKVIENLASSIGIDNIVENVVRQSKEFLSQGEPPEEEKKKRGRKKKE
jgi:hypothetical protein